MPSPLSAMPSLGLGTWQAPPGQVKQAVCDALELGYRHVDCASLYGNEAEIGAALQRAFQSGLVQREELWITSKLWNDCHAPEQVRPALLRSLRDLGLEHLDLYLIHWPVVHRHGVLMPERASEQIPLEQMPLQDTWRAMEALVDEGLVREIGVSNFSAIKIDSLLQHARRRPTVNQVERHPWLQQNALMGYCQHQGIQLTAYSPLGSSSSNGQPSLLDDPVICAIAEEHRASPPQVLLAWGLATGTAVIPKSVHRDRLASNLAALRLQLSRSDLDRIAALDRHHRILDGSFWELPGGPYTRANLWDEA